MSVDDHRAQLDQQKAEFQELRDQCMVELAQSQAQIQALSQQPQGPGVAVVEAAGPEVGSVAMCLPAFWTSSPELWFAQVEVSFDNSNPKITTDSSKYNHVLQALTQDVLFECESAISSQVVDGYLALNEVLLKVNGKSPVVKNAELLSMSLKPGGLGGKRSSTIMTLYQESVGQELQRNGEGNVSQPTSTSSPYSIG